MDDYYRLPKNYKDQYYKLLALYEEGAKPEIIRLQAELEQQQKWAKAWKESARSHRNRLQMSIDGLARKLVELIECQQQRDRLAEALEMFEFVPYTTFCGGDATTIDTCIWCGGEEAHEPDCPRQAILAELDE
jgi:hypothetical protein